MGLVSSNISSVPDFFEMSQVCITKNCSEEHIENDGRRIHVLKSGQSLIVTSCIIANDKNRCSIKGLIVTPITRVVGSRVDRIFSYVQGSLVFEGVQEKTREFANQLCSIFKKDRIVDIIVDYMRTEELIVHQMKSVLESEIYGNGGF